MEPVLGQALRTFVPYARKYGYELRVGDGQSEGRPPAWGKVLLLQQLLEEYDEVLWLDADVAIVDHSRDIADVVPAEAYQALVETHLEEIVYVNSGVWLVRADPRTFAFLQAVWDSTEYIEHKWWENTPLKLMLGYSLDGETPPRPTTWSEGTCLLPHEWNLQEHVQGLRDARFRHYADRSNLLRYEWIRADADRLSGNPRWLIGSTRRWSARHLPSSRHDLAVKLRRRMALTTGRA
jgi:hypothetical protein